MRVLGFSLFPGCGPGRGGRHPSPPAPPSPPGQGPPKPGEEAALPGAWCLLGLALRADGGRMGPGAGPPGAQIWGLLCLGWLPGVWEGLPGRPASAPRLLTSWASCLSPAQTFWEMVASLQPHSSASVGLLLRRRQGCPASPTGLGLRRWLGGTGSGRSALPLPALPPTARRRAVGPGFEPEEQGPSPPQLSRVPWASQKDTGKQAPVLHPPRPGPAPVGTRGCPVCARRALCLGTGWTEEDRSPFRARAKVSGRHAWLSKGPKPFPA